MEGGWAGSHHRWARCHLPRMFFVRLWGRVSRRERERKPETEEERAARKAKERDREARNVESSEPNSGRLHSSMDFNIFLSFLALFSDDDGLYPKAEGTTPLHPRGLGGGLPYS